MKTDRELLELAAKAAGLNFSRMESGDLALTWRNEVSDECGLRKWNPLEDDGDALRLAVVCKIAICTMVVDGLNRDQHESVACSSRSKIWGFTNNHEGDPFAATRRAIVRAAAAIGEAME